MRPFTPSQWMTDRMIEDAMRRFDAAREQARLRKEAVQDERMVRALVAENAARGLRDRWGTP